MSIPAIALAALILSAPAAAPAAACVDCHARVTPGAVADWKLSRHAAASVGCDACHGADHTGPDDASRARLPTADTCGRCHAERLRQFAAGKHAMAWAAMSAMPAFHQEPAVMTEGQKGCGGCHAIGLKEEADARRIAQASGRAWGVGSCDACHTRHLFSAKEARAPQACRSCHVGMDHALWEMYQGSRHGTRQELVQLGVLPTGAAAPTCQGCHMPGGDHGVITAWGSLAVRLPLPPEQDARWRRDQATILQALGILDPQGKPAALLEVVKGAGMARVTEASWREARRRMEDACAGCHARSFAVSQLQRGDQAIREADRVMAEAIEVVAGLYRDGILKRSPRQSFDYPAVLQFHDAGTVVEQKLATMFLAHRARAIQGAFHASPDQALWGGWGRMQLDLAEIRERAAALRQESAPSR